MVMQTQLVTFFSSCSVVLFVDEADAFLRKRSKVAIVCMTDNLAKRGRRGMEGSGMLSEGRCGGK